MSEDVTLYQAGEGRFELKGRLDFQTVPGLLSRSQSMFEGAASTVTVDLAGVEHGNSAGLGLLLEWMRLAERGGCRLHYTNLPESIRAVARTSELDAILPL